MLILFILSGITGGVLGGMGMGGGTLFIPLLTFLCGQSQIIAQSTNLICFIPMALISIVIHLKNKLIDIKKSYMMIISGSIMCIIGSFLASHLDSRVLKKGFGIFLIVLGLYQFISITINQKKRLDNNE